jgi:hypothetical protein
MLLLILFHMLSLSVLSHPVFVIFYVLAHPLCLSPLFLILLPNNKRCKSIKFDSSIFSLYSYFVMV